MVSLVVAGSDLAGRRSARQSHERPWVQSQTLSSCIRTRPALQTSTVHGEVPVVQARELPAAIEPLKMLPSICKVLRQSSAARKSLIPVRSDRTSSAGAVAPIITLADGSRLKSALRKAGTKPKKVTWNGNDEFAIYTKGMKTKFFDRELVAAKEEAN